MRSEYYRRSSMNHNIVYTIGRIVTRYYAKKQKNWRIRLFCVV